MEIKMLKKFYNDSVEKKIIKPGEINFIPPASSRDTWESLPKDVILQVLTQADRYIDYPWPETTARQFRAYTETGERTGYEAVVNERFQVLNLLILAESIQYTGRYLDTIVDGIWRICEESTWIVPAHNFMYAGNPQQNKNHLPLPDVTEVMIDLRAVMVNSALTGAYVLLKEKLDGISPLITKRIKYELERRIIEPFLERDDFWWMNFKTYEGMPVNNHNTYCNTGILFTFLYMVEDAHKRYEGIGKILRSLDIYLNAASPDGGLDEGPGYWGMAGGTLLYALEMLREVSGGVIDIYDEPLIRKIGDYMCKAHIDYPNFVNFADAKAKLSPNPYGLYIFGKRTGNKNLMEMGSFLLKKDREGLDTMFRRIQLPINIHSIFFHNEMASTRGSLPYYKSVYLPDLQVVYLREKENSPEGFFFAAKGGHNDESHNHNDVGNYILYHNGQPVIIDTGVMLYSAKTFNPDTRYSIWINQSQFHNLPVINGKGQAAGAVYRGTDIRYKNGEDVESFSLNLEDAYPEEGSPFEYRRITTFNRKRGEILVEDVFSFSDDGNTVTSYLMTHIPPTIQGDKILFTYVENGPSVEIDFSDSRGNTGAFRVEEIAIDDPHIRGAFGEMLYRIAVDAAFDRGEGRMVFRFTRK
jgi:hypothetical protein